MVMEAPEMPVYKPATPGYLLPLQAEDLRHITEDTSISITEEGRNALESGRATGAGAVVLNELSRTSPERLGYIKDYTRIAVPVLRNIVIQLARQGFVRISVRQEGR